jgi:hypothetical protein
MLAKALHAPTLRKTPCGVLRATFNELLGAS